jgi:hypothetical protein
MSRYRKVENRTWVDQKFTELSSAPPNGQTLWIYLLTNPDTTNVPGLFRAGEAQMAEALGWPLDVGMPAFREAFDEAFIQALPKGAPRSFREAWQEIAQRGMAKADWKARVVWVPNAIRFNFPESPNVITSWKTAWSEIPDCPLKAEAYQAIIEEIRAADRKESYLEAFVASCRSPLAKASRKPSSKAMPNQEQEQEQEQEKGERENARTLELGEPDPPAPNPTGVDQACIEAAQRMWNSVQQRVADARKPDLFAWARQLHQLRQDQISLEQAGNLFEWAGRDAFWGTRILSPRKLAEHWNALCAARDTAGATRGTKQTVVSTRKARSLAAIRDYVGDDANDVDGNNDESSR